MATLKVKIQEDIVLGNQDYGSKRTLEIGSINEIMKRVVTCAASQTTTIAVFNSNAYGAAGAIDIEDSRYIRITNLDSSNYVLLSLEASSHWAQVKVEAGKSFILGTANGFDNVDTSTNYGSYSAVDITRIKAQANTAAVDLEVFIATA